LLVPLKNTHCLTVHDDAFGGTTTLLALLQSTTAAKAAALKDP
tara:strand:- start:399 stop:527 length:129 start_codon:yes stop_codon:yes gene_type:complete